MKKISALLGLLLLVGPMYANDFGFRFGLKASPNISWFRPETRGYEADGFSVAYSYGLVADYYFTQNYAISSGLRIVRNGAQMSYLFTYDGFPTEKTSDYKLRYLEIPVTLKLSTNEVGYLTYFGQFGFGLGFNTLAEADERVRLSDGSTRIWKDVDVSNEISFMKASLILGAGVEYNFGGRTSLLAGLTFSNGFSNVLNYSNPDIRVPSTPSAVHSYLELTLGIMF